MLICQTALADSKLRFRAAGEVLKSLPPSIRQSASWLEVPAYHYANDKPKRDENTINETSKTTKETSRLSSGHLSGNRRLRVGCGLYNPMNGCFLNSVVQSLTHNPHIQYNALHRPWTHTHTNMTHTNMTHTNMQDKGGGDMKTKEEKHEGPQDGCSICEFHTHVRVALTSDKPTSAPPSFYRSLFLSKLKSAGVSITRQSCAYECLLLLLDWLREPGSSSDVVGNAEHRIKTSTTYIGQLIDSIWRQTNTCLGCNHRETMFVVHSDFVLSASTTASLQKNLEAIFKTERIEGVVCDHCKQKATRRVDRFVLIPPVLAIVMRHRAIFGGGMRGLMKDGRGLETPEDLDLSRVVTSEVGDDDHAYKLRAAIVHKGASTSFGHYVAVAKIDKVGWFLFNDESVTQLRDEEARRLLATAYVWFYDRVSPPVALMGTVNENTKLPRLRKSLTLPAEGVSIKLSLKSSTDDESPLSTASTATGGPSPMNRDLSETETHMQETAGDMQETAGDMQETAGDGMETAGDIRGDMKGTRKRKGVWRSRRHFGWFGMHGFLAAEKRRETETGRRRKIIKIRRPSTTLSDADIAPPTAKTARNVDETAGDMQKTAGDMQKTAGNMQKTGGETRETAGDMERPRSLSSLSDLLRRRGGWGWSRGDGDAVNSGLVRDDQDVDYDRGRLKKKKEFKVEQPAIVWPKC